MASSTEDYGSELQELQWGGGTTGTHFLRGGGGGGGGGGTHYLRSGTGGCYEAEDLEPVSSSRHHGGQHRGYYSPPGTSYTIVERPPSAPHHHSSHATPYRSHRGHTTGTTGAISPEQVLRLFGSNMSSERRQADRRSPASSPASVTTVRGTPIASSGSQQQQQQQSQQQQQQQQQQQANPPTSPISQPLSLQELTVRTITMTRDPPDSHHGFGICVKGGKDAGEIRSTSRQPPSPYFVPRERGRGVFISRVEEGSVADRAGLRPGDTILEVNGTPFRAVTHEEALKMLKSCRTLSMTVRGPALDPRCRGGHPVWSSSGRQQSCSWMDREGRPASPPPLHPPRDSRYGPRTRKVELCIEPGQSLGLMIRGGLEYGLGIYVTGVDKDSVADRAGLLVGDQIIEVNGQNFEEATHDEAVQILKTNKRMSLLIRDVGKVPHSCTTGQPIVIPTARYPEHDPLLLESPGNHRPPSPASSTNEWRHRSGVHTISAATAAMVEEKARVVLARSERAALSQLLADYRTRRLTIEGLVVQLGDLLNTHEKLTLLTELRELVDNKDRAAFDDLVYRPRISMARRKGDRAHSDLIVTPSLHDLPRGVPAGCCRPGRLVDVEGDPLGVTGPLLPRDNQEHRSPSEDSGLGADMPRTRYVNRRLDTCRALQQRFIALHLRCRESREFTSVVSRRLLPFAVPDNKARLSQVQISLPRASISRSSDLFREEPHHDRSFRYCASSARVASYESKFYGIDSERCEIAFRSGAKRKVEFAASFDSFHVSLFADNGRSDRQTDGGERVSLLIHRFQSDYDDEIENGRGRRHSSPGGSRGNPRDYSHHLHPDNLVSRPTQTRSSDTVL
ncbi:Whirlin [Ooceraea biroi]|uniref:Whirlin n=1 Tax=Ooceraea biroi TaxID=2015173 RepID=A0A026X351_OOCBI|nr:Whirlin [Ooceraea biroi]